MVSIIINNYNYARYLAEAIDSALGQAGAPVEVIVVDDGSTDHSREVIGSYGQRIAPVFKENGGQASAVNAGFARSRGEVVMFLDADDMLLPMAAARAAAVFAAEPGTAKVQYRMRVVDAQGRETGETRPPARIPLRSGDLRRQEVSFPLDLPWTAMSGNAYAARVLRQMLPIPVDRYRHTGADWYLAHVAALFGDVCALDEVALLYRIHGANQYGRAPGDFDLAQIRQGVQCAEATRHDLQQFADQLHLPRPDPILSVSDVAGRITSLKLSPAEHPVAGETVSGLVLLGLRASTRRFDVRWPMKLMFMTWFLAMGLAPRPAAERLAGFFFAPERRQALNQWLARLHRGATPTMGREPAAPGVAGTTDLCMDPGPATMATTDQTRAANPAAAPAAAMAVAIVSYNTRELMRRCLASLVDQTGEVFVFDNASTDGTGEMLRADYPQVTVLASNRNLGYGAAANRLLAVCQSGYALLLNTDTQLEPHTLRALQDYLDQHPRVAVVGPRLANVDGSLQASCFPFPSPFFALLRATSLGTLVGSVPGLRRRYLPAWSHDQARGVPWVVGAALAIRRAAFGAVGGFDESFFMYSEEVDLCYRLRAAGWGVDYAPVTTVTHVGGASTRQQRLPMEEQKYAATIHFYQAHYAGWQRRLLDWIVSYEMARNIVRDQWRLRRAAQAEQVQRLTADLSLWKRILRNQWQR